MTNTQKSFLRRAQWHFRYLKYLPLVILLSLAINPDNSVEAWAAGWVDWLTVPGTWLPAVALILFLNIAFKAALLRCWQDATVLLRPVAHTINNWVSNFGYICLIVGAFAIFHGIDIGLRLLFFCPFFLCASYVFRYLFECIIQRTTIPTQNLS